MSRSFALRCALAAAWAALVLLPLARAVERPKGVGRIDPAAETVDLFAAVEQGRLEVTLIPKDSSECRVMIKNLGDKPLNVRLPEAAAGVPVLAQFLPPNANNGNVFNNNNNNAGPQNIGMGFPQNMNNNPMNNLFNMPNNPGGRGQNQMFGPLFNIAPENVAQFRLECVCLDHGNPDPRPKIPYQLKPLEAVSEKAEVRELCAMLGRGEVGQRAAQAAAWHLANGMSWEQLKAKEVTLALGRIREPFFSPKQLAAAKKAVEQAAKLVKDRAETPPSDSTARK